MKKIIKIMLILAVIGIVVASVFSAVGLVHECTGEDCPVCATINISRHICEALLLLCVFGILTDMFNGAFLNPADISYNFRKSPVFLKDKMTN